MPGRRTVAAGVWIVRGSAHDPHEIAGATHLVEHLTLRSCGGRDRRELALDIDRLGGEVDAWTSSELMGVSVNTTVDAIDEALDLLVDAILTPTFAPDDVALELRVTEAELELMADDPAERVEEALLRAAWGGHSLARPVIGTKETLARLTPEVLEHHHGLLVRPGGMLAAVVGDADPARIAGKLSRLPLDSPPQPPVLPSLTWSGSHLNINREGTDQVHARLAFEALPVGDRRVVNLLVMNHILGDGAASRLFQRLREKEGLTYDVWSGPVLRHLGGLLEVGWACAPAAFPDSLELVREELAKLPGNVRADEVAAAKEGLMRGFEMDMESPGGRCSLDVGEVLERGRRFDPEAARNELMAVTIDDVRAIAEEVLRLDRMASAVCGPEGVAIRVA
jgi:predicted Zn-dependent peptidase